MFISPFYFRPSVLSRSKSPPSKSIGVDKTTPTNGQVVVDGTPGVQEVRRMFALMIMHTRGYHYGYDYLM